MVTSFTEHEQWRLVRSAPAGGATHMAIDGAIAGAVAAGESPPTLRIYHFDPPCLSIGVEQEAELIDDAACAEQGWDVVRRPTDSRSMLHLDAVNWSAILPRAALSPEATAAEIYAVLSRGIVAALEEMGLRPNKVKTYYEDLGDPGAALFDGPSRYEITLGQRKLVGSALAVTEEGVLLQSTMPLYGDVTRIARGIYVDLPGQRMAIEGRLRYRATNLLQVSGQRLSFDEAAEKVATGFAAGLGITLTPDELSAAEREQAAALRADLYASEAWWLRV